jgi:hypothetical protein
MTKLHLYTHQDPLFQLPPTLSSLLVQYFQLPKYLSLVKQLVSPQYLLLLNNIAKEFLIYYVNNWFVIEFVNLLLPIYTPG